MKVKVVDVSIRVTCLAEDAEIVCEDLNRWFCENETPMVQRPRNGGIAVSSRSDIQAWMRETLCPEDA